MAKPSFFDKAYVRLYHSGGVVVFFSLRETPAWERHLLVCYLIIACGTEKNFSDLALHSSAGTGREPVRSPNCSHSYRALSETKQPCWPVSPCRTTMGSGIGKVNKLKRDLAH